ncbi:class I SAM-dependent methyltransferase [Thermococcus aciditolerans]|nr:class I SAM-dependent methyltransferase [Thermococcus aciditolerans]
MEIKQYSKYLHHWTVELYEQTVTEIEDVQMIKKMIGDRKEQHIFEVCCGSGRILVPLAKDGHIVVGLDMDNLMLAKLFEKTQGLENITVIQADAITANWGEEYDVVILAGNVLLNIISNNDNKVAQQKLIEKSYSVLKPGGHIYLDTHLVAHPEQFFGQPGERVIFEGIDSWGTYGRYILIDEKYNAQKQVVSGVRRFELRLKSGETFCKEESYVKHIPTAQEIEGWITAAGLVIERRYGDYKGNPISETTNRAIYWAKRNF